MKPNLEAWYSTWFDSAYYHLLYKDRDHNEAEFFLNNLLSQVPLTPSSRILDLACGKGRHSVFLHQQGHDVIGVDLSANSINEAKKHASETLNFFVHDMLDPIKMGPFDAILNLFTSFGYFDDVKSNSVVLEHVKNALKEGGIFVLDYLNSEKVIQHLVSEEEKTIEGVNFSIQRKLENGQIIKSIRVTDGNLIFYYREQVQALFQSDFEQMFQQAGFEIQALWGDYSGGKFDPSTSNRLIIYATRNP